MPSVHMSFRLNHYQLAKAVRILITLEPNQPISSLSQAAKLIIIDWISKHSINTSLEVSQADVDAIKLISEIPANQIDPYTTIQRALNNAKASNQYTKNQIQQSAQKSAQQIQRELEEEAIFLAIKREAIEREAMEKQSQKEIQLDKEIDEQIKLANQNASRVLKPSSFHDPNKTESIISSMTDFSPPEDWKE